MKLNAQEQAELDRLDRRLRDLESQTGALRGIRTPSRRNTLLMRIVESQRRDRYVALLEARSRPTTFLTSRTRFDPPRAVIAARNLGDYDEACWLAFLMTHFAAHRKHGWTALREVYFGGSDDPWTWPTICASVSDFRDWLDTAADAIRLAGGRFGNHRKYESLGGWTANGTGNVVSSYVSWVGPEHSHVTRFTSFAGPSEEERFDQAFRSVRQVHRFGRLGAFDYLMNLSRFRLLEVRPGHAYLAGASGPRRGAALLFGDQLSTAEIHNRTILFGDTLGIGFDIVEDAVCNWQKSPSTFMPFRG